MYQQQQPPQASLPYSPPFVVNVQISQQYQQFFPFITGIAMKAVMDGAPKNQIRGFTAQVVSQNNWQNQEFAQLVQQVAWMGEYYFTTQRNQYQNPEQAFHAAAEDAVRHLMARLVQQYHSQLSSYITQEIADSLNRAAAGAQQWAQEMARFHQQMAGAQQPQYPTNYGAPVQGGPNWLPQNPGYGQPAPGPVQPIQYGPRGGYQQQPNSGFQPGRFANSPNTSYQPTNQNPPDTQGRRFGLRPRRQDPDTNQELTFSPNGDRSIRAWSSEEEAARIEREQVNDPTGQRFTYQAPQPLGTKQSMQVTEQWPKLDNPERPYDGITFEDGSYMKPAATSGWQKTFDPESPYTPIFNPDEFVLFHLRRPDGVVVERLEPRTADMKYEDHELDPKLKQAEADRVRPDDGMIVPVWKLAERMRPSDKPGLSVSDVDPSADQTEDLPVPEPQSLETVPTTHSLQEGLLRLASYSKSVEPNRPVEVVFEIATPIVTPGDLKSVMKIFESATSFEEVLARLYDHRDMLSEDVSKIIDQRLTRSINDGLRYHMGLKDWTIDSFAEDYKDLLAVMKDKFGENMVSAFCEYAPEMIGRSMAVLTGDGLSNYLAAQNAEDDNAADYMLVFRDRCSVTQVPWTFSDMKLDLSQGSLIPDSMEEFRAAVAAIFARTEDWPVSFSHRYIQTSDKRLLELRRGYLAEGAFLIHQADQQ